MITKEPESERFLKLVGYPFEDFTDFFYSHKKYYCPNCLRYAEADQIKLDMTTDRYFYVRAQCECEEEMISELVHVTEMRLWKARVDKKISSPPKDNSEEEEEYTSVIVERPKRRGRPPKNSQVPNTEVIQVKRPRGRPRKEK